ncbi:integrase/recombinase XerD [Halanaerobium saccharolyticum]|jgi:integrase/recombinase XerD|uniref:Integrase/recombinase XerD n=1 Tax=Halanaerobium saccharolyticum TaxID=43595 RepID=A0A2T5RSU3_9FIRM|nr:tyrosine-type recombinase/integrase [Halanaerobium saccharolyticum]PTW03417.1 integrase/recombinase XerD [Halanaerobium saccharolyticum]
MIKIDVKQPDLEEILADFLEEKRSKRLSPATIDYYENNIHNFIVFTKTKNKNISHKDVNKKLINEYLVWLDRKYNYNTTSANTALRAIRVFVYYMIERNDLNIEPFKILLLPDNKRKKKEIYSTNELSKLLEKPNIKKTRFSTYRNWVIINFFLTAGARIKTTVNIQNQDIDLANQKITLFNYKTHHTYQVSFYGKFKKIIEEYMGIRKGAPEDYLFSTEYGEKLSRAGLRSAIVRYNNRRGVDRSNIHAFRHTFASLWIKNGGDPYRLMDLLDHQSMEITKQYVHQFSDDESMKNYNPLESLVDDDKEYINLNK